MNSGGWGAEQPRRFIARGTVGCKKQAMRFFLKISACAILFAVPIYAQQDDMATKARLGKDLMAAGRFEEAIPIYRDLVRMLPNNPGPVANLGIALHMAGHDLEATKQLQAALKIDPSYLPARLYLGSAYLGLNEVAKAIEPLRKVIQVSPENVEARQLLGEAFLGQESFEAAAEQFEKLRDLDASNPKGWAGLGRSYEGLARRNFEELEKVAMGSAYWLALVAESRFKADQHNSAFFFYREALKKMPTLRGVHASVAEIYRKNGHPDWAAIEDERELELPPLNCIETDEVSKTAVTAGRRGAVVSPQRGRNFDVNGVECKFRAGHYREIVGSLSGAKTAESYYWRSRAYDKLAAEAFSRLGRLRPSAQLHELIAQIHFGRKRCLESAREWKEALKFSPANPYYEKELSISLSCSKDYEGAREILENLVRRLPDSAEVNYWLGFTLLRLLRAVEAVPYLERAVEADPSVLAAHRELAGAYLEIGKAEKAIPHLMAALPIDKDGSLYYQLARAYRSTGEQAPANEMLKKFREIQESSAAEEQVLVQEADIGPP